MRLLSALTFLAIGSATVRAGSSGCLCTYGQPCWPSAATFAQLQSQVSQPLVYPLPSASGCYPPSNPSGNCPAINVNWRNGTWRSTVPGSAQEPNFELFIFPNGTIDSCYLNSTITGTCGQGNVPVIGVDARTPADVQAALNFAVQQNLKIVVKNTGHDYLGRSMGRDSFMVWTHNMKNITYDPGFTVKGGPASETYEAVTIGAGVLWQEAYVFLNDRGRIVVGGWDGTVGAAGGWLAGGGHSMLSPSYGLGVDNTLEISVVLSTGQFLVANKYQNSDLFWALLGGGGGTYGVMTSVTYRTYPSVPAQFYGYEASIANETLLPEIIDQFLQFQPQFTTDGWGGYGFLLSPQLFFFVYMAPNMTNEDAVATTSAWRNYTRSLEPYGLSSSEQLFWIPSSYQLYESVFRPLADDGEINMLTSRLLSADTLANNHTELAEFLITCRPLFFTIAGGRVNQIDANSTGLNPAWRNAILETTCAITWDEGDPDAVIQEQISLLQGYVQTFNELAPNDGAYFNEASLYEIDWQTTFFGDHYSALKEIKEKYDPNRLFVVAEGVGSEDWSANLTCRS